MVGRNKSQIDLSFFVLGHEYNENKRRHGLQKKLEAAQPSLTWQLTGCSGISCAAQ